jgi:hypothetical protein
VAVSSKGEKQMALLNMTSEQSKAVKDWIHKEYGRKAGLFPYEYDVQYGDAMKNEIEIKCGKVILILIKYPPWHEEFKPTLRRVFSRIDLREFLRSQALVKYDPEVARWRSLKMNRIADDIIKHEDKTFGGKKLNKYTVRYVTELEVVDNKTKARVAVKLDGNAFTALDKALKILYGAKSV